MVQVVIRVFASVPAWRCLLPAAIATLAACAAPPPAQTPTPAVESAPLAVIPAPATVEHHAGEFDLVAGTRVYGGGTADGGWVARYFVDLVRRSPTLSLRLADADAAAPNGGVRFVIDPAAPARPGAYVLGIEQSGVTVAARDRTGLLYGAITLWQMTAATGSHDGRVVLPALRIEDAPRFSWRGLMLDSARHYQSPEFIERFIDWMVLHKLNVLHWHLTDDQAWRLEIRKYPELTSIGAWRVPAGRAAAHDIDPATGRPRLYGGYYTQDTVRHLVRYAAERGVTVVPEIEMPGHATAAIAALPRLGVDGHGVASVPADWGIYPNLYNVEDDTFVFLEDVLREVMELFPGEYIHVGGDEAVKDQWHASPQVQQRMRERGIADEHALQSYFVQRIGRFLQAHDRRLVGWDEILEGGLAPDATVMSWRGIDGALAAAAAGHDAVLSPWPVLYFDNRQGVGARRTAGSRPGDRSRDVYRFDPMPGALPAAQQHHILGLQANLWTEHIRTEERVQWMTYPRAAAVAEVAWSPATRLDYADFRSRLTRARDWYPKVGLTAADSGFRSPMTAQPQRRRSQELATCTDKLVLNLEDDAPLRGTRAVFLVDVMQPCWTWQDADLAGVTAIVADGRAVPVQLPDRQGPGCDPAARAWHRRGRARGARLRLRRRAARDAAARARGGQRRRDDAAAQRRSPARRDATTCVCAFTGSRHRPDVGDRLDRAAAMKAPGTLTLLSPLSGWACRSTRCRTRCSPAACSATAWRSIRPRACCTRPATAQVAVGCTDARTR